MFRAYMKLDVDYVENALQDKVYLILESVGKYIKKYEKRYCISIFYMIYL